MRHSVLFQRTGFDRTPERSAVPEGYLTKYVQISD